MKYPPKTRVIHIYSQNYSQKVWISIVFIVEKRIYMIPKSGKIATDPFRFSFLFKEKNA